MKRITIFLGAVLVAATGCGDDTSAPGTGGAGGSGTGGGGAGGEAPLELTFDPIDHDLDFSLITDLEFARSPSDEFMVTDLAGGFAHDPYEGKWTDTLVFGDTYVGFLRARRIDGQSEDFPVGHLQWASAWAQGPDGHVYVAALADFPPPEGGPPGPSPILRAVLAE